MAHVPRPHVVSGASPVRLLALSLIPLAAVLVQVARLKVLDSGGVLSSGLAEVEPAEVGAAEVGDESETDDEEDFEAHRRTALKLATEYADALDIDEPRTLSQIRDILRRLRDFTASLILHIEGESNDAHSDLPEGFDGVLRDIQSKYDGLDTLATQKESEGEVDDGGDVLPSKRDNICNSINFYHVDQDFRVDVKGFCDSLDNVRASVMDAKHAELNIFQVCGRLHTLRSDADYAMWPISERIALVLGQERRWISNQFAGDSKDSPSPDGLERIFEALSTWVTDEGKDDEEEKALQDTDDIARGLSLEEAKGLQDMHDLAQGIGLDEHLSLTALRTRMHRLDTLSSDVEEYMKMVTDSDKRSHAEDLARTIKESYDGLAVLAERREEAGEVDEVAELMPSQRNNICRNVDDYGLDPRIREEVLLVCDALDRWRKAAMGDEDEVSVFLELSGRLMVLKSKPDYADGKVVGELETVLVEEWRWRLANSESGSESGSDSPSKV